MAPRLSQLLGQPVIVENIPGAGCMIDVSRVARLVISSAGSHAYNQTLYKNPLYNSATDFAPVMPLAEMPLMLVTRKDLPVNNLQEFIAYTKAHQTQMSYGSAAGTGSAVHIVCVLFNSAIGVTVSHVPYRASDAVLYQDLSANRIDYHCPIANSEAAARVETGQDKAIAVFSKTRSALLPNVPTADEQGLMNFEGKTWFAFFLPKRTPAAIVQKL